MNMHEEENNLLQAIYNDYQESLRRIAQALHVPNLEVDDVVQETFISYFGKYSLTWAPYRKKAMLIKILKRKAIDSLRKNGHYMKVSLDTADFTAEVELLTKYAAADPLDIVVEDESIERIKEDIANMREEWRVIAVLYFLEQRTIPEICEILGISGTVCRSRIYRTRMCLKKILGPRYNL